MRAPVKLFLASSNAGKLGEFRALAQTFSSPLTFELALVPGFDSLPQFEEAAPTFAENALGKALHYSRLSGGLIIADDSGLVVPALGGAPGVRSARFAGAKATSEEKIARLLEEMRGKRGGERAAHFACVIALAERGRPMAIVSDRADGMLLEAPRGSGGFGYDPVFYFTALGKTFAELSTAEKNQHSHRGRAFRILLHFLPDPHHK